MKSTTLGTRILLAGLAVLLLASCASKPTIRSYTDPDLSPGNYSTFGFFDQTGTDKARYQSIVSTHFRNAITREMEARGYTQASNPDLLINFNAKLDDKQKVSTVPSAPMTGYYGYYGYRGAMYTPWPAYNDDVIVTDYTEGTVNIDLVDAQQNKLVWEGVGIGRVTEDKLQNIQASINSAVTLIFQEFTWQAR